MSLEQDLHRYIANSHLPGEDPDLLQLDTPLIESGILDSLAITQMMVHLEKAYGVKIGAQEITEENLGTINQLAAFLARKQAGG